MRSNGSGSEGSKGMHPVLMYVDARPRSYLVEAKFYPHTLVNVCKSV